MNRSSTYTPVRICGTGSGPVRVGIEATGYTHWFEAMLAELGHELWMGDAAKIRAMVVRKQKTDARDAAHLLELLQAGRFPKIGRPSVAERDLRQLLWHRQKLEGGPFKPFFGLRGAVAGGYYLEKKRGSSKPPHNENRVVWATRRASRRRTRTSRVSTDGCGKSV